MSTFSSASPVWAKSMNTLPILSSLAGTAPNVAKSSLIRLRLAPVWWTAAIAAKALYTLKRPMRGDLNLQPATVNRGDLLCGVDEHSGIRDFLYTPAGKDVRQEKRPGQGNLPGSRITVCDGVNGAATGPH